MTAITDAHREGADGQIIGGVLLQVTPDRLTLRRAPKTWLKTLLTYGLGLLLLGAGLLFNASHHRWAWFTFFLCSVLLILLQFLIALLQRRDEYVWDRATNQFTYNGSPLRPLSEIAGVETEHFKTASKPS